MDSEEYGMNQEDLLDEDTNEDEEQEEDRDAAAAVAPYDFHSSEVQAEESVSSTARAAEAFATQDPSTSSFSSSSSSQFAPTRTGLGRRLPRLRSGRRGPLHHAASNIPKMGAAREADVLKQLFFGYTRVYCLGKQHIQEYDDWINVQAPKTVYGVKVTVDNGMTLGFSNLRIKKPSYMQGGSERMLTPAFAREQSLNYVCKWYVDLDVRMTETGRLVSSLDHQIMVAEIPCMVRSCKCNSRCMSREQLVRAGEELDDPGGYFVLGGGEMMITYLEKGGFNLPICITCKETNNPEVVMVAYLRKSRKTSLFKLTYSCKTQMVMFELPSMKWCEGIKKVGEVLLPGDNYGVNVLRLFKMLKTPADQISGMIQDMFMSHVSMQDRENMMCILSTNFADLEDSAAAAAAAASAMSSSSSSSSAAAADGASASAAASHNDSSSTDSSSSSSSSASSAAALSASLSQPESERYSGSSDDGGGSVGYKEDMEYLMAKLDASKYESRSSMRAAIEKVMMQDLFHHIDEQHEELEDPNATDAQIKEWYRKINVQKSQHLAMVTAMLLEYIYGLRKGTDRDGWSKKRIMGASRHMDNLLKTCLQNQLSLAVKLVSNPVQMLDVVFKLTDSHSSHTTETFATSFIRGKWGVTNRSPTENKAKSEIVQRVNRESKVSTITQLCTTDVQMSRTDKQKKLRRVQCTQYGFIDAVACSEGTNAGLVKGLSMMTSVSTSQQQCLASTVAKMTWTWTWTWTRN